MLILFTIFAVFSAILAATLIAARRKFHLIEQNDSKQLSAENFRPLFAPTDEDIRAFENAERKTLLAKERENARRLFAEKIRSVHEFEKIWRVSPDKRSTVKLLVMAAETEDVQTFSKTAENVIKLWRENRIESLKSEDLADLLDSHFRTLPQQERTSGIGFWLKEEVKNLRSESEENL